MARFGSNEMAAASHTTQDVHRTSYFLDPFASLQIDPNKTNTHFGSSYSALPDIIAINLTMCI